MFQIRRQDHLLSNRWRVAFHSCRRHLCVATVQMALLATTWRCCTWRIFRCQTKEWRDWRVHQLKMRQIVTWIISHQFYFLAETPKAPSDHISPHLVSQICWSSERSSRHSSTCAGVRVSKLWSKIVLTLITLTHKVDSFLCNFLLSHIQLITTPVHFILLYILFQGDMFVGKFTSNVDRIAFALMAAQKHQLVP